MKFKAQNVGPVPSQVGRRTGPVYRSNWIRDWLADQPRFVRLSCGRTADLNDPTRIQWRGKEMIALECNPCQSFCNIIEKHITMLDHLEMPPQTQPDDPPF